MNNSRTLPRIAAAAFLLLVAAHVALAQDAAAPAAAPPKGLDKVWYFLATSSFAAGLIFLFLATITTVYVSRLIRDRCLKAFRGYQVSVELKDGLLLHGRFDVERSGMEFVYTSSIPYRGIADEASFLLYSSEYPRIYLLMRYLDYLSEKEKTAREEHGLLAFRRKFSWRAKLRVRNAFASVKDAMGEALNMIIGRIKGGTGAGAAVVSAQQRYVQQVGTTAIGYLGENSFDPLLEKQIGRKMIVEVMKAPGDFRTIEGTFIEYSGDFIELLDVCYKTEWTAPLPADGAEAWVRNVKLARKGATVIINNPNHYPMDAEMEVRLPSPQPDAPAPPPQRTRARLEPEGTVELALSSNATQAMLKFSSTRMADVIVPRAIGLVRHKSETPTAE